MKLIIIAAGKSSRLRTVTDGSPKTLLKVNGKTIIDQIAKVIPIIRRYRGPRLRGGLMRECHKQDAERVSIYGRVK